jgi:hypothetical protein
LNKCWSKKTAIRYALFANQCLSLTAQQYVSAAATPAAKARQKAASNVNPAA